MVKVDPSITQRIQPLNKDTLKGMIEFLLSTTSQEEEEIEKGALKLAEAGWALCPMLPPKVFKAIAAADVTSEYLNQQMIDFYTENEGMHLTALVDKYLLSNQQLQDWKVTIEQSKKAYDAELFNVAIPALITVVEGLLAKLVGTFASKNVRMIGPTQDKALGDHTYKLDESTWLTISKVIENLYQKSDFTGEVPEQLNRHWILHGRHTTIEANHDALRLFNLLGATSLTVV